MVINIQTYDYPLSFTNLKNQLL